VSSLKSKTGVLDVELNVLDPGPIGDGVIIYEVTVKLP
jgi:hypothetical protein